MNTTFLIQSTKNTSFGTAFCVANDDNGAFLVTCTHVVESCVSDCLVVDDRSAKLVAIGSSDDIDLAIIYVEGLESAILSLSTHTVEIDTALSVDGFKPHKSGIHLQRTLQGSIAKISKIHSAQQTINTYELMIENDFSIERGYSGSAIVVDGQVVGVATDRNSNGKQAYAIPISYLKEIWQDMPPELFAKPTEQKSSFSREVFETLDTNPLLLYSTDSYNHTDYIEHIREEAIERFGKPYLIDINCRRFGGIRDSQKFFNRLAKTLGFGSEIEDSFDFEEAFMKRFEEASPLKSFVLIIGFERLNEEIRNSFAESLRSLHEQCSRAFHLVIFGGEKLIQLKYSTGKHSYFNIFAQKMIPAPTFAEWKSRFDYLSLQSYEGIMSVTGGYQQLSEYCFEKKVQTAQEAQRLIYESFLKSELFRSYADDELCRLLAKEALGDAHPYCDNKLLYRLYWDNLIVEYRGQFVWRSAFINQLGREVLGC